MRDIICQHAKLNSDFWDHFMSGDPNMQTLFEHSNKMEHFRTQIQHEKKHFIDYDKSNYISPFLTYGLYQTFVNNDVIEGEEFINKYVTTVNKTKPELLKDELSNHNIFCATNVMLIISGAKHSLGKLLQTSENFESIFEFQHIGSYGKSIK